jgi:hypothetical protein
MDFLGFLIQTKSHLHCFIVSKKEHSTRCLSLVVESNFVKDCYFVFVFFCGGEDQVGKEPAIFDAYDGMMLPMILPFVPPLGI